MSKQKKTIPLIDSFLEQKKDALLIAVYEQQYPSAEQIYHDILKHVETNLNLSENTEKHLNQIQTIFKRFKPQLLNHCSPKLIDDNSRLKKCILSSIKQSSENIKYVDFQTWERTLGLTDSQKALLYKTAMTFQLTSGCSNYCRRCNEWALPKVRSHFSYDAIHIILHQMARQNNTQISLYGASDPLDWSQNEKSISDILDIIDKLPIGYSLLTKVPKGKDLVFKHLLKRNSNLSVSITSKNKTRIQKIEHDLRTSISRQHDDEDLLIPAGFDEDFVSVKPSITDGYGTEITPDGAFIIIPAFTSALHPFGHKKLPVTPETCFFPIKKIGREALLIDYFKPLEGYDLSNHKYHLSHLMDVQIESIILDNGADELTPPGMRSIKEYLSIFEEKARLQRKKMTLSVLKKLKKQFLKNKSFKDLSQTSRALYLKRVHGHLNFCKKKHCLLSKLFAISFFLESIIWYGQQNPVKIKIIQFLLKNEIERRFKPLSDQVADRSIEAVLKSTDMDSFEVFRFCIFCLITHSKKTDILLFLKTYSAVYDPVADIFIGKTKAENGG